MTNGNSCFNHPFLMKMFLSRKMCTRVLERHKCKTLFFCTFAHVRCLPSKTLVPCHSIVAVLSRFDI